MEIRTNYENYHFIGNDVFIRDINGREWVIRNFTITGTDHEIHVVDKGFRSTLGGKLEQKGYQTH